MAQPLSLVTGACGFMGTHMVEVLTEAGHRVRATDLASACRADDRKAGRFPSVVRACGAEIVPADVTDPASLRDLAKDADYVFHIAAIFSYSAPWSALERVNVGGTRNVLEEVLRHGRAKRFVAWGAGGVYGNPVDGRPFREDMPTNPMNDYCRAKDAEERLVMEFGRTRGLPWTVIRPTGVYGPRAVYGGGQLVMGVAQMKVVAAPANFTSPIPFVHVRDVVSSALHFALEERALNQVINVTDDSQMSYLDYLRYVAQLMGNFFVVLPPIPIRPLRTVVGTAARVTQAAARRFGFQSALEADSVDYIGRDFAFSNEKMKSLGYRMVYPDARDGLRQTIEWYRREGWIS